MKAIVLWPALIGAVAWSTVASAQYGYGVPGGYYGHGGLAGGGGPSFGTPNSRPSYGAQSPGFGSGPFQGFSYSPYQYSSPSYGLLSPSFGGTAPRLGFTVPTYSPPPATYGAPSYGGPASVDLNPFRSDGFLSASGSGRMGFYRTRSARGGHVGGVGTPPRLVSYYATGFGYAPIRKSPPRIDQW